MRVLRLSFAILCTASLGHAADIRVVQPGTISIERILTGECSIMLNGVIEKGDADRLERILESEFPQEHSEFGESVCLDSPGGSLDEGVNIAAVLGRHYTATIVPEGATCLSACAVAFMGGNTAWYEYWFNARLMHASAKVGFHAPTLEVPDGAYDKNTVQKAFNIAITAIGRVANELSGTLHGSTVPQFPGSLFGAMLQHHGSDFLYIDTVEKAATWDVKVLGAASASPNPRALETLCYSAERWLVDQPVLNFDEEAWILEEQLMGEIEETGGDSWRVTYGEMFFSDCRVERSETGWYTVNVIVDDVNLGEGTFGGWAAFAPNTALSSLD